MDVSEVGLGAALLQTRSGTSCLRNEVPENRIVRPIALVSNSLYSMEKRYSNIERKAPGTLYRLEKFHTTALQER